ncbi:chemotaxis protein CheW [Candidatus Lokiarchaeum ossiferum]|uniref:chemotaxis protein CheW n=1 Tax=Candidatus Lokiarchaeum ossiferum TaxID=2951803 RepID=UPI00352C5B82
MSNITDNGENSEDIVDVLQYQEELELDDEEIEEITHNQEQNKTVLYITITLQPETELKYTRAYLCLKKVREFGKIFKTVPNEANLKEENFDRSFRAILISQEIIDILPLKQNLGSIAAVDSVEIVVFNMRELSENLDANSQESKGKKNNIMAVQNVKVSIKHLDNLMNLTGELLITKIRLDKIAQQRHINELNETLNLINRITFDLQDEVLQMRMIPVSHIFDRFPRMVRDLTKSLGKLIDFSMEGREIELDRTIIDEIGDPIVHLLRNSVDHGIEKPDIRITKGKNRIASLKLRAYRERNFVIIEIADDGKGIDFDKIKQKALKRNLITSEEADQMTDYDLKRLLLGGGISTADKISEISGRGVGLGVVKQKIESIGGIIDVDSKLEKGTTFLLKLPLTVAIIKSLLVSLGSGRDMEIYAIPINNVVRTIVIHESEIRTIKNKEVITIMGKIVSIVRLRKLVSYEDKSNEDQTLKNVKMKTIIVIERNGMEVGLMVDSLIGQQEIVIKSLGGLLKAINGVSGGAILGDGKVALIIDVGSLF